MTGRIVSLKCALATVARSICAHVHAQAPFCATYCISIALNQSVCMCHTGTCPCFRAGAVCKADHSACVRAIKQCPCSAGCFRRLGPRDNVVQPLRTNCPSRWGKARPGIVSDACSAHHLRPFLARSVHWHWSGHHNARLPRGSSNIGRWH